MAEITQQSVERKRDDLRTDIFEEMAKHGIPLDEAVVNTVWLLMGIASAFDAGDPLAPLARLWNDWTFEEACIASEKE